MSESTQGSRSRRGFLGRSLLALGAVAGVGGGAVGTRALGGRGDAHAARRLELRGHNVLLEAQGKRPGELVTPGDRGTLRGELLDGAGRPVGRFHGTRTAIDSGASGRRRADGSIELHTFELPEGTILGMGSVLPGGAVFSVVGGTGRYAGARGSYTAEQRLRELGGDGTADFVIDLSA